MGKVLDLMLFSTAEDEPRFRETLQLQIDAGHIKSYRAFAAEPAGKKKARDSRAAREAREAEEVARELGLRSQGGGSDMGALSSALALRDAARKSQFGSMIASVEERFGEGAGKAGKQKKARGGGGQSRAPADLDDPLGGEAFAAAQARMLKKCKGGR
jgi:DnaJ family protein C protein 9